MSFLSGALAFLLASKSTRKRIFISFVCNWGVNVVHCYKSRHIHASSVQLSYLFKRRRCINGMRIIHSLGDFVVRKFPPRDVLINAF